MAFVKYQLTAPQVEDANGDPLVGGSITAYLWDTSTPTPMYTNAAGDGADTSFTLNTLGNPQTDAGTAIDIFLDTAITYKFIIRDSAGTQVGPTIGPVYPAGGTGQTAEFASLEEFRASSFSGSEAVILAANAGTTTGRMILKATGTSAGTPTLTAARFTALAGGEIINAGGYGYRLDMTQRITPYMFGAIGDGVSDDLPALTSAIGVSDYIEMVGEETYNVDSYQNGLEIKDSITINGTGQATLKSATLNRRALNIDAETALPVNVNISNMIFENNASNTDDWAPIRVSAKGGLIFGNYSAQAYYGFAYSYSIYNDKTERRPSELRIIGNWSKGSGTGFEQFSMRNSVLVGNVAYKDGTKAASHGFRFTGFDNNQTLPGADLRNRGNASAGNAAHNYAHGVSQQVGTFANVYSGYAITDCTTGLQFVVNNTGSTYQTKWNVFSGFAIDGAVTGIFATKTEKHVVDSLAISNCSFGIRWEVASSASTHGTGKYNRVSGLIADQTAGSTADTVFWEAHNSRLDLTIADTSSVAGRGLRVVGNFNLVTVTWT